MTPELVPMTPEAEEEHKRFLQRCQNSLLAQEAREKILEYWYKARHDGYFDTNEFFSYVSGDNWRLAVVEKESELPKADSLLHNNMLKEGWVKEIET